MGQPEILSKLGNCLSKLTKRLDAFLLWLEGLCEELVMVREEKKEKKKEECKLLFF